MPRCSSVSAAAVSSAHCPVAGIRVTLNTSPQTFTVDPQTMALSDAVAVGVAGVGGYARTISELILKHGADASPAARLVAVCDPQLEQHADRVAELRSRGVEIFSTYQQMLGMPGLEAVWLPLPIQLHRPFAEQALAAGKTVAIEKPAAGTVDDVDALIAARDRAGRPAIIGFQDIYDLTITPLKRRILDGEFGRITHATLTACWPRAHRYFSRSHWAGRQRVGDTWVLDSPANNALAHPINLTQFLLGPTLETSATPLAVEAELYRAADIENYDTVSSRATLDGGTSFLTLLTHATATTVNPRIVLQGERGRIVCEIPQIQIEVDGRTEVIERPPTKAQNMLHCFARLVRGEPTGDILPATLEVARNHTLLINGISEAAAVVTVPSQAMHLADEHNGKVTAITGIEDVFDHCARHNQMLHESGRLPFTRPAGRRDLQGYTHFAGPKKASHEPATTSR